MLKPLKNNYQNQILALTGLFQAAGLVHTIATGQCEPWEDFSTSIESIFVHAPTKISDCYPNAKLHTGKRYLRQFFNRDYNANIIQVCRYSFSLFKAYRLLKRNKSLYSKLANGLKQYKGPQDDPLSEELITALADLYVETLGSLSFRIQIIGKKLVLNDPKRLAKMRALLLAGVRSAVLWEQVGGSLLKLFLFRKHYLKAFENHLAQAC